MIDKEFKWPEINSTVAMFSFSLPGQNRMRKDTFQVVLVLKILMMVTRIWNGDLTNGIREML